MIILYSNGCPKCNILKKKLKDKNISYIEENDQKIMLDMGLKTVPWLKVNEKLMDFYEANKWINEYME